MDLNTISGATQRTYFIPITFGSATNIAAGQDIGIEWIAGVSGASAANGFVDPLASITGVQVLDANNLVPNFSLTDNAGDVFGPAGSVAPEPRPTCWSAAACSRFWSGASSEPGGSRPDKTSLSI